MWNEVAEQVRVEPGELDGGCGRRHFEETLSLGLIDRADLVGVCLVGRCQV